MTDPNVERKLIEIMRIISKSDKPLGARLIADELQNRGYAIGERAVRYHLRILDERGFTKKHGYIGRTITELGQKELNDALIGDRLDFVITRIEELVYKTTYDLREKTGNVIVNVSIIDKSDYEKAMDVLKYAIDAGVSISPRIRIVDEDSEEDDIFVPDGKFAIANVCSITYDGILLKNGIPSTPLYGGLMQMEARKPVSFVDLIGYSGTSIDPIKIFINRHSTSVLDYIETGTGKLLANLRQIPGSAREKAREVMELAKESEIGGYLAIGETGEDVFGMPMERGKAGIPVTVGSNAITAIAEAGIPVKAYPVSTTMDYNIMKKLE